MYLKHLLIILCVNHKAFALTFFGYILINLTSIFSLERVCKNCISVAVINALKLFKAISDNSVIALISLVVRETRTLKHSGSFLLRDPLQEQ